MTVAVLDASPLVPVAVKTYEMVSGGVILCVPLAGTVPRPLLIATFVAPLTFHRRTADWPRSIVDGSAENSAIVGTPGPEGCVLGAVATGAGGGGGGIGAFLLQAAAKAIRNSVHVRTAAFQRVGRNGELLFMIT